MIGNELRWSSDPQGYSDEITQEIANIGDKTLRQKALNEMERQRKAVVKSGKLEMKPVESMIFKTMNENREQNGFTVPVTVEENGNKTISFRHYAGSLEDFRKQLNNQDLEDIKKSYGENATRESVLKEEEDHFADQQSKMRDWFEANPNATLQDAQKHLHEIQRPYVMAAVSKSLKDFMPVAVENQEDYDALPSGAYFIFNGRIGTVK